MQQERTRNIKLTLEYDGSRYAGWQKVIGKDRMVTIQGKLEEVLAKMEGKPVEVIGAARTEPGAHAYGQIANFHTTSDMSVTEIKQYLNRYLPMDIAVLEACEMPDRFHASYLAKEFVYEYKVTVGDVPSVFERKYNYYCFKRPDMEKMKKAASYLLGGHDFKAFSDNRKMKKSTVRVMKDITIYGDDAEILFSFRADDFWPHMVRILVGTLLAVGKGELEPEAVQNLLTTGNRDAAGETIEARGLFLSEVRYDVTEK
ncbi:MAG: tRNA pseudouridine(38-40) synthase TruA [Lachnospiraceae bacterium]|nr:tRNA pseudouridine(38-40) synthase TruA [Lachnospiraceae bacterium]